MSANKSTPRAVRLPNDLDRAVMTACGGPESFGEWARNVFRRAVGIKLDRAAGYEEGFRAGWTNAGRKFREAMGAAAEEG